MEIGVYCTSIRPHLWGDLFESLSKNDVDYNICMAGPCPPIEPLPGNVKYIQTNVKPPQCWFIAANNTKGDYVINITDDARFSPGCLDSLLNIIQKEKKVIVSPTYINAENPYQLVLEWIDGKPSKFIQLVSPCPIYGLMKREDFNSTGIDKSFIGAWWDTDQALEFISNGGKTVIDDKSTSTDIKSFETCHLALLNCGDYDNLLNIWTNDRKTLRSQRLTPIDKLIYDDTVLTVSQGPKLVFWD